MSCDFPEGCNCGASEWNALERENAELREECARLKAREVVLSDRQSFLHIALHEAGFPDHEGEDESYRTFGLTERVARMAAEMKLLRNREATTMGLAAHIEKLTEDKARLDWLKAEPYGRLQRVREWLPISHVPPAPDIIRAAVDNAMRHDPNYRP